MRSQSLKLKRVQMDFYEENVADSDGNESERLINYVV